MTLLDLRRYAIRKGMRVQFHSPEAGECVVNEHGVLRIPALAGVPSFRFDSTLGAVERFVLIPVHEPVRSRTVTRQELESLVAVPAAGHSDHDD
jgi:hypothetical protein